VNAQAGSASFNHAAWITPRGPVFRARPSGDLCLLVVARFPSFQGSMGGWFRAPVGSPLPTPEVVARGGRLGDFVS
jgi:hypothetical protein